MVVGALDEIGRREQLAIGLVHETVAVRVGYGPVRVESDRARADDVRLPGPMPSA